MDHTMTAAITITVGLYSTAAFGAGLYLGNKHPERRRLLFGAFVVAALISIVAKLF